MLYLTIPEFQINGSPISNLMKGKSPVRNLLALCTHFGTFFLFLFPLTIANAEGSQEKLTDSNSFIFAQMELSEEERKLKEEQDRIDEEERRIKAIKKKLKIRPSDPDRKPPSKSDPIPEGMIFISGGKFNLGKNGGPSDSGPAHLVVLSAFFIDKYEVTQNDFKAVTGKNPSKFKGPNRPVERVSWYKARKYCKRLGKRLPTEAEWEFAARGGTDGGSLGGYWYSGNSRETQPVGQKEPNSLGLYDMLGNIWEWTADWYNPEYYKISARENPGGPIRGKQKVLRGGSWKNSSKTISDTYRSYYAPAAKSATFGFRCAK